MKALAQPEAAHLRERAVRVIPGGVNSNVRLDTAATFFDRGQGAWLWDVDGKDYVDYLLGQGPAFLGHAPQPVLEAVEAASRKGIVFGAQHALEVEAAERLCAALGWPQMVRFGSSGTEMVQAALRLAHAATGRKRFVRFEGHYHGWIGNVLVAGKPGPPEPASAGQFQTELASSFMLPWNNLAALAELLGAHGSEIAAILMEPVMYNAGAILPRPGYLAGVKDLCRQHGAVLIFDETITGFRLALGGAAARFGVTPDIAIYGKAVAGGWPAAALAGSAHVMEPLGTGQVTHAGTFNANLMATAAIIATLDVLTSTNPYPRVEEVGRELMSGLAARALALGTPLHIQGLPGAFHLSFGPDSEIVDFRDVLARDQARYRRFASVLEEEGVWVARRGIWYLSAAHGEHEIEVTLERFDTALRRFEEDL
jgi:glutamate-1-semialdehyde 2,1-aminomutase